MLWGLSVFGYGVAFDSVFMKKLRQYLTKLSNEKRQEWLILFTHNVADRPGLFDTRTSTFGQILSEIHSTGIPVKTTTDVIAQTENYTMNDEVSCKYAF